MPVKAGHNQELLDTCPALKGYALLVQYTREYQAAHQNELYSAIFTLLVSALPYPSHTLCHRAG